MFGPQFLGASFSQMGVAMSELNPGAPDPNVIAQRLQAKLLLGVPKRKRPLSDIPLRSKLLSKVKPERPANRPSHDLSVAQVISLIEKRLKWIDRSDLKIGLMNYYDDNYYMIELVGSDLRLVYQVYADATDAQFYWVDVSA